MHAKTCMPFSFANELKEQLFMLLLLLVVQALEALAEWQLWLLQLVLAFLPQ